MRISGIFLPIAFAAGLIGQTQPGATMFDKLVSQLPPAAHEEMFGARIQRTVSLLNDSSPERRYPVTILVYGQSITENLKRANLDQALQEKFPYADITFLNRSISGFSASQLVRSAANDIYPLYPDLNREYSSSRTASEVRRRPGIRASNTVPRPR
jgi:hypothetical protein